ncbi:MAG: fibronectin type III domain-containing protein, partial [Ignavibacteria bacterium]|nr:fibronectin type III domain-containing protein [Ignavibacteria bacterium]
SGSTTDPTKPVVIAGLDSKTQYDYEATATVSGQTSQAATGSFTTLDASTLPPAPTVTLRATANSVTFTFTAVTNATSYDVKVMKKQGNGGVVGSGSTTDPTKPVVIAGIDSKTQYNYEATVTVGTQTSEPTKGDFTTDEASTSIKPPEVTVEKTTNTATFTFKEVSGATLYEVRLYDKQNTTNATPIDRGSTTDPTKPVAFTNLTSKQKYYYEATVTVGTQTSEPTKGDFTTDEIPPSDVVSAPTGLRVSDVTATSASVSWTGVGQGVRFEIEVSPGGIRDANASSPYALTSLSPGTQYTWSVKASKGNAVSEWIAGPTFTTLGTPPPPPADAPDPPAALQVSALTPTSAMLSWTGNIQGARFELQVSPAGIAEPNANAPYTADSLTPSTRYSWYVRTTKGNVSSNWIQGPSFTTPDRPTSAVEKLGSGPANEFVLSQNYPNPFNPATKIEFSLPVSSHVRITIYNALGNLVEVLADQYYAPGRYVTTFEAAGLPTGVYFYRLQTTGFAETKRLMLVK